MLCPDSTDEQRYAFYDDTWFVYCARHVTAALIAKYRLDEDTATSDAMTAVFTAVREWDAARSLGDVPSIGWVLTRAKLRAIDLHRDRHGRRPGRRIDTVSLDALTDERTGEPFGWSIRDHAAELAAADLDEITELRAIVRVALEGRPRLAATMDRILGGATQAELAAERGCTRANIQYQYARAVDLIRKYLDELPGDVAE